MPEGARDWTVRQTGITSCSESFELDAERLPECVLFGKATCEAKKTGDIRFPDCVKGVKQLAQMQEASHKVPKEDLQVWRIRSKTNRKKANQSLNKE